MLAFPNDSEHDAMVCTTVFTPGGSNRENKAKDFAMMVAVRFLLGALLAAAGLVSAAWAQSPPATLRAAVFVLPPFVVERDGRLTGFSIELWDEIAARMKIKTDYRRVSDLENALNALRTNSADLLVPGIFITVERDREFDFSYMIWGGGQQIMVRDAGETPAAAPLEDLIGLLFSKTSLAWLGVAVVFMLLPAHFVWFFERRHKDGIIPTERYFPGIFHAVHWSATTLLTQAEQTPRHPLARVLSFLWMFTGVVFVSLYTAQLTANIAVGQIRGAINGPEDLPGKRVGTIMDSVSAEYLRGRDVALREFSKEDDLIEALLTKKVDAVVFSAAPLHYYSAHEGKGLVRLVGPEFDKREAGIAFPNGSPLRRQVDSALVALQEDGTYRRIYKKWFGGG
jgi:polar amino acid transport system substrate-binding protein